jgi:hypothetical protein
VEGQLQRVEVALSILSLLIHPAEQGERPHTSDGIHIVDVLTCEKVHSRVADVSDLTNKASR